VELCEPLNKILPGLGRAALPTFRSRVAFIDGWLVNDVGVLQPLAHALGC
jgi:hypothetical protein